MPVTPRGHNRTIGEASAAEFIDSQGGVGALMSRMDEYHDIVVRMRNERCVLMKEYPNQWVAMGKDGVVAVGNSYRLRAGESRRARARGWADYSN